MFNQNLLIKHIHNFSLTNEVCNLTKEFPIRNQFCHHMDFSIFLFS